MFDILSILLFQQLCYVSSVLRDRDAADHMLDYLRSRHLACPEWLSFCWLISHSDSRFSVSDSNNNVIFLNAKSTTNIAIVNMTQQTCDNNSATWYDHHHHCCTAHENRSPSTISLIKCGMKRPLWWRKQSWCRRLMYLCLRPNCLLTLATSIVVFTLVLCIQTLSVLPHNRLCSSWTRFRVLLVPTALLK